MRKPALAINSSTAMANAIEVSFVSVTNRLAEGGIIFRIACGRTTRRMACCDDMPVESAASRWPLGTARTPVRNTSAKYAASYRPRPVMPAKIGSMTMRWSVRFRIRIGSAYT